LARPIVKAEPEILAIGCYLIRLMERVAVAALLVARGMERQVGRLITRLLTVAVLTMPGEIQIRHCVIANIGDRRMAIAAIDLGVSFTRRITCLTDLNEGYREESSDQKESNFTLGSEPGDAHISSIGIRATTFLCESCTVWKAAQRNPSIPTG